MALIDIFSNAIFSPKAIFGIHVNDWLTNF